jgi:HlyD family secretion protein
LKPAAPSVERSTVWIETVRGGLHAAGARGGHAGAGRHPLDLGTTSGRVQRILLRPGAQVKADTVILELTNPDLEQSVNDALLGYARRRRLREPQDRARAGAAHAAGGGGRHRSAVQRRALKLEAKDELLAKQGLVSQIQLKQSSHARRT